MGLFVSIIIGAIAGWLAGAIMKSKSAGVLFNILLGIAGSFVGNWAFNLFGVAADKGWLGTIVSATVGAIILIVLSKCYLVKRGNSKGCVIVYEFDFKTPLTFQKHPLIKRSITLRMSILREMLGTG